MTRSSRPENLPASVLARLLNHARAAGEDYQFVLARFALERLLYRLSRSSYRDRFVVKGAILFLVWSRELYRPTRDLDLMVSGSPSGEELLVLFREVFGQPVEVNDAIRFDPRALTMEPIREQEAYGGMRVGVRATLGKVTIPLQVDIGFGDAITPRARKADFPTLLEFPAPRLSCYPPETVVAEKFETLVKLGIANSRMRDYYDLWILTCRFEFEGAILSAALRNTFKRRRRTLPPAVPVGLSDEFAKDAGKRGQWTGFCSRSRLSVKAPGLEEVVARLRAFLLPPCSAVLQDSGFRKHWPKNGPWR